MKINNQHTQDTQTSRTNLYLTDTEKIETILRVRLGLIDEFWV